MKKKIDKLIWQSQTLLKPTSCNCFLIQPGSLNKKKKERRKKRGGGKERETKKRKERENGKQLEKEKMEGNREIKVIISFVVNQYKLLIRSFFPSLR